MRSESAFSAAIDDGPISKTAGHSVPGETPGLVAPTFVAEPRPMEKHKEKSTSQLAGMVAGGCMFIGMGIGWALGSLKSGLFIGMGVGLVAMAILLMNARKGS